MTRRSQKQKTGNSSGSGSGKPHLAAPPATEHRDVVRQIFESLNIQFERLRSDPVMRGQRDPTTLHNFAALLNRAVTPVTTEEKIVFETIRYLSDANRAKLCRWMFSAHLACISLCADERLVALGLNVPSDILVAMRPDGALVIRHSGPSGMSEFGGKGSVNGTAARTQEAAPPSEQKERLREAKTTELLVDPQSASCAVQANPNLRGTNKLSTNPGVASREQLRPSGRAENSLDRATAEGQDANAETHPAKDSHTGDENTLSGANKRINEVDSAVGRKRDGRRPVVTDARYQQVLESLKAASTINVSLEATEPKKQNGEPSPARTNKDEQSPPGGATAKTAPQTPNTRHLPQSAARPSVASGTPAANGQSGSPQSYRDAVAMTPDRATEGKKTGTPVGILRNAKGAETAPPSPGNKPAPSKAEAPSPTAAPLQSAPKRALSRIEEDTELLLDFVRVATPARGEQPHQDEAAANRPIPAPQPAEPTVSKITSWADAPSDEEDKEADLTVRRARQPQPEPKRETSEAKRTVTFANDRRGTGRDARTESRINSSSPKDAQDKRSNRRGGRRRRRRDQSSTNSNSA